MTEQRTLLIEIGTEELPPLALQKLSQAFSHHVSEGLKAQGFSIGDVRSYATPRRLAVTIYNVPICQATQVIQKRGPSVNAATDKEGKPSKAALGFAQSCQTTVEKLQTIKTDKGEFLYYETEQAGAATEALLQDIIEHALAALPIPKRMRWGSHNSEFVRPVHWVVLLFGGSVVETEILGIKTGRLSYGHRFYHPDALTIALPEDYESIMAESKVIADFEKRRDLIKGYIAKAAQTLDGQVDLEQDAALLDEVTALVEWPAAVAGSFDQAFLDMPKEVLIMSMKANQKYFPVFDKQGALTQHFITISNIESKDPAQVKAGNERVIRPRLADAQFFWEQDQKISLDEYNAQLEKVVFQKQLGTISEKVARISRLAVGIAKHIKADEKKVARAAQLSKADLMTDMVGEFPKLQGVMGRYYAQKAGEDKEVALAIEEHYRPVFAGGRLPDSSVGQCVAIADKLDTIVGIFAIGQKPTGVKDPFSLRRAAIGVIKIIIEHQLEVDLYELIKTTAAQFPASLKADKVIDEVFEYSLTRLRGEYETSGYTPQQIESVLVLKPTSLLDIQARIQAVKSFSTLPEAESLAAANKRIRNILKKAKTSSKDTPVQATLFAEKAEKQLFSALEKLSQEVSTCCHKRQYTEALKKLASLKTSIDSFFDDVMVMADDASIKNNRLALLSMLQKQFLQIADITELQV